MLRLSFLPLLTGAVIPVRPAVSSTIQQVRHEGINRRWRHSIGYSMIRALVTLSGGIMFVAGAMPFWFKLPHSPLAISEMIVGFSLVFMANHGMSRFLDIGRQTTYAPSARYLRAKVEVSFLLVYIAAVLDSLTGLGWFKDLVVAFALGSSPVPLLAVLFPDDYPVWNERSLFTYAALVQTILEFLQLTALPLVGRASFVFDPTDIACYWLGALLGVKLNDWLFISPTGLFRDRERHAVNLADPYPFKSGDLSQKIAAYHGLVRQWVNYGQHNFRPQLGSGYRGFMESLFKGMPGSERATVIYPMMGPDLMPALFWRVFPLNNDLNDLRRGKTISRRDFGWSRSDVSRAARHVMKVGARDALDPTNYDRLQTITGMKILILKGFMLYHETPETRRQAETTMTHIFRDILKPGDRIIVLHQPDKVLIPLAEREGFIAIQPSTDFDLPDTAFAAEEGMKVLMIPNTLQILEKQMPPDGGPESSTPNQIQMNRSKLTRGNPLNSVSLLLQFLPRRQITRFILRSIRHPGISNDKYHGYPEGAAGDVGRPQGANEESKSPPRRETPAPKSSGSQQKLIGSAA